MTGENESRNEHSFWMDAKDRNRHHSQDEEPTIIRKSAWELLEKKSDMRFHREIASKEAVDRLRLLVCEDDDDQRRLIQHLLKNTPYDIHCVGSGREAIEVLNQCSFDILLTDWLMPSMDGVALCRHLNSGARTRVPYILLMTALSGACSVSDAIASGADDYLCKPLKKDELLARLESAARYCAKIRQHQKREDDLRERSHELYQESRIDALTKVWNRRQLEEDLRIFSSQQERYGREYTFLLADVDHFKAYNDNYGHPAGDRILTTVAGVLKDSLRCCDKVYRYGGEEFMIVLTAAPQTTLKNIVTRIQDALARVNIIHQKSQIGRLSLSFGAAVLTTSTPVQRCIKEMDRALYRAKEQGRNRLVVCDSI